MDSDNQNISNNIKTGEDMERTRWEDFLEDWSFVLGILFRPLVICPALLTAIALYFANSTENNKPYSILLNILASISLAFSGGFIYDGFKRFTGDTILIKKGLSAVRNLSLSRVKIRNIASRAKLNVPHTEVINLLSILEKDIANATQEWNDILPGVTNIEEMYNLLEEKESELQLIEKEKDSLDQQLKVTTEVSIAEKKYLAAELENKNQKINDLSFEINNLKTSTSTPLLSGISAMTLPASGGDIWSVAKAAAPAIKRRRYMRKLVCSVCGKEYYKALTAVPDMTPPICDPCRSKPK